MKRTVEKLIGERQAAILALIIDSYIKTGEPIGSKTIAGLLPYKISSATIRNEMAYLSELGLLEQMHTSGGRVPSKASFRYFVDNLMIPQNPGEYEKEQIQEFLSVNSGDPERLLHDAASLLARETNCAALYNTVRDSFDCVQGAELIPAGNNKAMIVMLSVGGKIKSSVCRLTCAADEEFRKLFYYVTGKYFIGTALKDVNPALLQNTVVDLGARVFDMLPALTSLCSLCAEAANGSLEFEGETNLLSHKELGSQVYKILSFLASRSQVRSALELFAKSGRETQLFIGNENPHPMLKDTVTLVSKFTYNNSQTAVLGIIGSTRIDYASVLPRAEYIMNTVKKYLREGGATFE